MKRTLLSAVMVVACAKGDPPPPAPPSQDGVELIAAGDASTARVLRYQLAKGTRTRLELVLDSEMHAGARGGKLPTSVITFEITAEDVLADGSAKLRYAIVEATARDRDGAIVPAAMLRDMAQQTIGVAITGTLSPTGKLTNVALEPGKELPAAMQAQLQQLVQSAEQLAMPLPAAAVGAGAKWSFRRTAERDGLALTTVTTMQVTAIDGDRVSYTSTTSISAPDQTTKNDVAMKDIGGGGTSAGVIDLRRATMTGKVDVEFRGTISVLGQPTPTRMAMSMTMR